MSIARQFGFAQVTATPFDPPKKRVVSKGVAAPAVDVNALLEQIHVLKQEAVMLRAEIAGLKAANVANTNAASANNANAANKPDRRDYQRDLMRKRRAAAKGKS